MIPLKSYNGVSMVTMPNGQDVEATYALFRAIWGAHLYNCSGGYGTKIEIDPALEDVAWQGAPNPPPGSIRVTSVYAPFYHALDRTFSPDGALLWDASEQAVPTQASPKAT